MPQLMSANALKRLGERFASGTATAEDGELLNEYIASCDEPMSKASDIVTSAGFAPTSRLKTRGTLVEKLQRDPNTKLPSVQDVAGLRVTVSGTLLDQDAAVAAVVAAFEEAGCSTRVRDRREDPSFGYRAVHVIATVDRTKVEVQVRTQLQDLWAQLAEKTGDVFGRQTRYGAPPSHQSSEALNAMAALSVRELRILGTSLIPGVEMGQVKFAQIEQLIIKSELSENLAGQLAKSRRDTADNVELARRLLQSRIIALERVEQL